MGIDRGLETTSDRQSGQKHRYPLGLFVCLLLSPIIAFGAQAQVKSVTVPIEPVQPSLWWASERVDEGLVEGLTIDPNLRVVRIVVNLSVWDAADYIKRYSFMQRLGNSAIDRNYGIVLKDRRQRTLAEFSNESGTWAMEPANLDATPFRANLSNPFAPRP
ncbi:hypothetical protein [Pseudanabaena sp. PCC 6802]|uniref:hypothetical protein n=1 Tax=Pseudanabaena sp. PCC 6802 TaxID=118173 RepID=UPI000347A147|nr:hypothetical protein [Pseudanabaena sp. PCC 6802]